MRRFAWKKLVAWKRLAGWKKFATGATLLLLAGAIACPPVAFAQEPPRRNLFDMLFGGPRYDRSERGDPYKRGPVERRYYDDGSIVDVPLRPRTRPSGPRSAAPRPQQPVTPSPSEPVAKIDTARQVLVVGDFMAGNVGDELDTTFEASPGVTITERNEPSSGLVRLDRYDWSAQLPAIMDQVKPAVVVIMLGANDRQQMQIGDNKEKVRSDAWLNEYEARVAKLAGVVTSRKIPLLWVGLPAFQSPSATADATTFNTIYRAQVEKAGGEFVDIWDGFVDEDGTFVITGSDVTGQQVRLRNSDGINFTRAGRKKLAFYVEKFIRRHLGDMASPDLVKLDGPASPAAPAAPGQAVPTHPISLSDPDLDGGKDLLGGGPLPAANGETPRDKLVRRGELAPAPAGRIDDYRLPGVSAVTR